MSKWAIDNNEGRYDVLFRTYNSRKVARQAFRRAKLGDDYTVSPNGDGKWIIVSSAPSQIGQEATAAVARVMAELLILAADR